MFDDVFQRGTLVHLVKDDFHPLAIEKLANIPKKDIVYTVRDVMYTPNGWAILLQDLYNPVVVIKNGDRFVAIEPNFNCDRFQILGHEVEIQILLDNGQDNEYT